MLGLLLAAALAGPFTLDGGDLVQGPPVDALPANPPPVKAAATSDPDGFDKHLSVGGSVSNAQSTTAVEPYVDVLANLPLSGWNRSKASDYPKLRLEMEAQLVATSAPSGSQVASGVSPLANLSAFKSISFQGSVHWVFANSGSARETVFVQGGASSVLGSGPTQPTTANPGHVDFCLGVSKKNHTASASACPLSFTNEIGDPATAGRASGRVTVGGSLPIRFGIDVIYPYGNAPSNFYAVNQIHNVLTIVSVSYDFDKVAAATSSSTTPPLTKVDSPIGPMRASY